MKVEIIKCTDLNKKDLSNIALGIGMCSLTYGAFKLYESYRSKNRAKPLNSNDPHSSSKKSISGSSESSIAADLEIVDKKSAEETQSATGASYIPNFWPFR